MLHVRLGVRVRHTRRAKVLDGFSGVLRTSQKHDAFASRRLQRQLIERQALTTSLDDSCARRRGKSQRAHRQFRYFKHSHVVRDGADNARHFPFFTLHKLREFGQRQRRSVRFGHEQPLQHRLVEFRVRSSREETVEFHQQRQVDVFGLLRSALRLFVAAASFEIDTLLREKEKVLSALMVKG